MLRTSWVEPGYLETDASWCAPGGEPASPLANGGAFGGKLVSEVGATARALADEHGRPVRVLLRREDVAGGAQAPSVAGGFRADGTGLMRVVRTPGIADAVAAVAPGVVVEEVDVPGPPTSAACAPPDGPRRCGLPGRAGSRRDRTGGRGRGSVGRPGTRRGGRRRRVRRRGRRRRPLDEVVLRSYVVGATHMGMSWVRSEGLAVDGDGVVHDLTIRSSACSGRGRRH